MKRRKASTKMTNVVHQGWMIKSPPERKLNAPFKIFRSQWKKRYFVLRKPSRSLHDQYELHYYKDERLNSKKGSIDLEQCEQIIEALDSEVFPYLLAIKTYCKNKVRTYYLAVETEHEMNTWVQWLCHVCGLKPEDQPTDIPEPKTSQNQTSLSPASGPGASANISNGRPASPSRAPQAAMTTSSQKASSLTVPSTTVISKQPLARPPSESSLSSYIPLENCTTGHPQPQDRRESVESVPDFQAPSPPQARMGKHSTSTIADDDVFVPGLYDRPPPAIEVPKRNVVSDLYKVPPVRTAGGSSNVIMDIDGVRDSTYDVPPPGRNHSPRLSFTAPTDSAAVGDNRATTPVECYDYPPQRLDSTTSSDSEVPPERPPKPGHLQSPYQNLPPAGKGISDINLMSTVPAPPKAHTISPHIGYDVPRSSRQTRAAPQQVLSVITPPPPRPHRQTVNSPGVHTYLNTQKRPTSGEVPMPLPLRSKSESGDGDSDHQGSDHGDGPPAVPPHRHGSVGDASDRSSSPHSIYQVPPSSSSTASSSSLSGPPARPPARGSPAAPAVSPRNNAEGGVPQVGDDGGVIFSTQRTRSFKRHHLNNNSPKLSHRPQVQPVNVPVPVPAPVPAPRPVVPSRPKEMSTSDEDDPALHRLSLHDQEEEVHVSHIFLGRAGSKTHHPLSLLRSVPAPLADNDRELKYIDLDLPDAQQDAPRPSHGHGHSHSHSHSHVDRGKELATEYREIDFVKTQALSDAKRVKEKERKNDDH